MGEESWKKSKKVSWSKTLVRKWFNIKSKAEDFHADDHHVLRGGDGERRKSFREIETCTLKKSKTDTFSKRNYNPTQVTSVHNYSVFTATWNVGGKSPPSYLSLEDWLNTSPSADIYVLGFQEIVPLNAGNVLGAENNGPAKKWLDLIRKSLNNLPDSNEIGDCYMPSPIPGPVVELDADFEASSRKSSSFFNRRSFHTSRSTSLRVDNDMSFPHPRLDRRFSVCDRVVFGGRGSDYHDSNYKWSSSDDENEVGNSPSTPSSNGRFISMEERVRSLGNSRYCLVASKQMVGIFLTVWVRNDLTDAVRNLKVSCVGRGLMGYLGNKGSISISMSLHNTTFCFICSHLTSGQKEGDELRRNSDVMEILRKTRFPLVDGLGDLKSPEIILDHDRIIWLGDLNYRIALSYSSAKALVEMHNWRALLDNDQARICYWYFFCLALRIEQKRGRVFRGWKEGRIYFPPTYKYSNNSDRYAGDDMHPKEKRRTPAWCDRILWHGRGLHQLSYVRGESRFSDHRPAPSRFAYTRKFQLCDLKHYLANKATNLDISSYKEFLQNKPFCRIFKNDGLSFKNRMKTGHIDLNFVAPNLPKPSISPTATDTDVIMESHFFVLQQCVYFPCNQHEQ
ncbi:hypothetical protein GIB67_020373 [Kingdonia uniflora]|uniref:Inositol polyphosphate-related phosphatase domain-containing protein n=1 Tax=Kingdonia uniflora TaxID=39325 RepID=A0A7J7LBQ8_9MAGN|nr:hypothetical protein GIB67_020373 [Kingdonia uniflora]